MAELASIALCQSSQGLTNKFDFLRLPAELRNEIYRHALKCKFRINSESGELIMNEKDQVVIHLLRTCKQIYWEGCAIFYGENKFAFCQQLGLTYIPTALPKHNLDWLKEVTISVPFEYTRVGFWHESYGDCSKDTPIEDRLVSSNSPRVDLFPNMWIRAALDALASAAQLQKLHLVIPPKYCTKYRTEYRTEYRTDQRYNWMHLDSMCNEKQDHTLFRIVNSDVWEDLEVLVRCKPALEVSCTRLYYVNSWKPENDHPEEQQALMWKLQYRLGIWDFREAGVVDGEWELPKKTARYVDLSDLSEAFHLLFKE
jgi:hypothetical protein